MVSLVVGSSPVPDMPQKAVAGWKSDEQNVVIGGKCGGANAGGGFESIVCCEVLVVVVWWTKSGQSLTRGRPK